jgi:hypothetical protein
MPWGVKLFGSMVSFGTLPWVGCASVAIVQGWEPLAAGSAVEQAAVGLFCAHQQPACMPSGQHSLLESLH